MSIARIVIDDAHRRRFFDDGRATSWTTRAPCASYHTYACDDDYPSIYVYTRGLSYRVRDFTPIARARVVDRRRRSSSSSSSSSSRSRSRLVLGHIEWVPPPES
jgi:hypothetical protein